MMANRILRNARLRDQQPMKMGTFRVWPDDGLRVHFDIRDMGRRPCPREGSAAALCPQGS
jgi:hypothetical protein